MHTFCWIDVQPKKKPFFCLLLIVLTAACCFFIMQCSRAPEEKPNLILIVADSLRRDVLGCHGGDALTPNIDRLAKNGVMFSRAYSTAPCTFPSSTSMLTGMYSRSFIIPTQNEAPENLTYYMNDSETLLGEYIRDSTDSNPTPN
jgi:phosphoglycerol transferase MdoB-like AlkP superfamily enzyme